MKTVNCPDCKGEGINVAFACPGFRRIEIKCFRCDGAKVIPDERLAWIEDGAKKAMARRGAGISLREKAKQMGILPEILTRMEMGIIQYKTQEGRK